MGKLFDKIFNAQNLAGFLLLLVIIITVASIFLPQSVPASLAPQLEASPVGTYVSITEDTFDAGAWLVDYPRGWRVVKSSVASAPVQVVFVSPDEILTVTIGEQPLDDADRLVLDETLTLYMMGDVAGATEPADNAGNTQQELVTILNRMKQSVRAGE